MNKCISERNLIILSILGLYGLNYQLLDFMFFSIFNGHLLYMPSFYQYFFAILNHRYENFCVIVLILSILSWVLLKYSRQKRPVIFFILFASLWYEIGFQLSHKLEAISWIAKTSPSLKHGLYVDLSQMHALAKVYAPYAFPSGHALIFGYFGAIVQALFPIHLQKRFLWLSILCCIPRLVSGAHALSDILAGYGFGMLLWRIFAIWLKISTQAQKQTVAATFSTESLESHFRY